uniref:DUF3291 domain-containing protein n=1 Tax=Steinernema glaseri TaxID=37863 RepID=A0A1I8AS44_9BILA
MTTDTTVLPGRSNYFQTIGHLGITYASHHRASLLRSKQVLLHFPPCQLRRFCCTLASRRVGTEALEAIFARRPKTDVVSCGYPPRAAFYAWEAEEGDWIRRVRWSSALLSSEEAWKVGGEKETRQRITAKGMDLEHCKSFVVAWT